MPKYDLTHAQFGSSKLEQLLDKFWEPFAVTVDDDGATVWLRKVRQ